MTQLARGLCAALLCLATACAAPDAALDLESTGQALSTWKRTIVFIRGETRPGQDMFVRGGIDHAYAARELGLACTEQNGLCAIPIRHRSRLNNPGFKFGDSLLDWYGAEPEQVATGVEGSPLDWTTNTWPEGYGPVKRVGVDGFGVSALNDKGPHYWMLDVEMDCARSVDGWFEIKSFISNGPGWEPDVRQAGAPYTSGNHFAKCGAISFFARGESGVETRPLSAASDASWLGNATVLISRGASGNDCASAYEPPFALGASPIVYDSWVQQRAVARNVCFEVYKPGVTESGDAAVLEAMDLKVVIRYTGQTEFTAVPVSYAGDVGNNVRVRLNLVDIYPFSPYECPKVPHEFEANPYPTLSASAEFYFELDGREYRPTTPSGTYAISFTGAPVPYEYETRCVH